MTRPARPTRPTRPSSSAILRASFRTLRANPRLLWFPFITLLGAVFAVGFGATLAWVSSQVAANPTIDLGPWSLVFTSEPPDGHEVAARGLAAGGFLTLVLMQLWSLICAVSLSRATMDALAGRAWTVRGSTKTATSRLTAIATVAIAQAGVGRLLGKRKQKNTAKGFVAGMIGRFTTSVLEMTWWAVTYLVVPVLAKEKCNGISALRRSGKLFKKTWKEAFVGRLALGWVWAGFGAAAILPFAACIALGVSDPRWLLGALIAPAAVAVFGTVFVRTLDMVYRTALYVFATEGVVPEPFDQPEFHDVFAVAER
ncbi:MAG: hypothetical protein KUG77_21730 [Nannocystaceae bacterium]|nr:hypothetical protein [Nannocystaceae bacterium]